MTYISWSSEFALYLENIILWDCESVWHNVWPQNIYRLLLPIFHGLISWRLFDVWTLYFVIMSQCNTAFALNNVGHSDLFFHGLLILPYILKRVGGSKPTSAVLCPWARHFTPRKYWLITQEAVAPSRHDWKIVDWDVKPQHKQTNILNSVWWVTTILCDNES